MAHNVEHVLESLQRNYQAGSDLSRRTLLMLESGQDYTGDQIADPMILDAIQRMLIHTRTGFQLTQVTSDNPYKQLAELDTYTIPGVLADEVRHLLGITSEIDIVVPSDSFVAFLHFQLTLQTLNQKGSFSFADLPDLDMSVNLGSMEFEPTLWNLPYGPDTEWGLIGDLQKTVKQCGKGEIEDANNALRMGHFFAAGAILSEL